MGCSSTVFAKLNITAFAPIPTASVVTARIAKAGFVR